MTKKHFTIRMLTVAIMAMVSIFSFAETNLSLRFTADDAGDITSSKTIGAFTIIPGSKTTTIEAGSASVSEETFTHRVKFGGGASTSGMYISFEVSGPCVIKAYGASGGSSTRSLKITCGDTWGATTLATICSSTSTSNVVAEEYNYTGSANTIYIGSAGSGYYVYGIDVTYGEGGSTETRYTVSFNANTNGTCSTSSLTEASEGAGVTLPAATANYGYNFLGWSTSSSATTAEYEANTTYKPTSNITLYAVYEVDANAPVIPAAGTAMTFDPTKRYSEWVINSRLNDFYGNETYYGFYAYDNEGNKSKDGSTATTLDYVPGLVAKAILEAVDYYKNDNSIDVKPWYYSMQKYANNSIKSDGKAGKSFDDLNAVKLYFKLQEVAKSGAIPDAADTNISNTKSITTANTRLSEALAGIKIANRDYAISESLLSGAAGGWWHKSGYTNQMWCDGQYMGPALLAQMLNEYENYESDGYIAGSKSADWDLVTKQFTISWNYLWDDDVKLLYHAFTADPYCTIDTDEETNAAKWYFPTEDAKSKYHSAEFW